MKKQLLTAAAVLLSVCGYAQTKGTSTLGLALSSSTNKSEYADPLYPDNHQDSFGFSLGYGYFIKDNVKLGLDLNYSRQKNTVEGTDVERPFAETYGGSIIYQQYFPLIGKFYAFAGGKGLYSRYNSEQNSSESGVNNTSSVKGNQYGLTAIGGLSWFFSKRWALETQLLSAGASFSSYKQKNNGSSVWSSKDTNFGLSNGGFFRDTSFKIYFLF